MPTYDYLCSNCETELKDLHQSTTEKAITHCTSCGNDTLERVIHSPMIFVRQEATTIGQLSERNAKRLGQSEVQERTLQDKDSKKSALKEAKKEIGSKINKMNSEQKRRFIEGG